MSIEAKANLDPGTEMKFLAPPLAERFNLDLVESDNYHDMIDGLRNGGCAIVNVGGDYEDTTVYLHAVATLSLP